MIYWKKWIVIIIPFNINKNENITVYDKLEKKKFIINEFKNGTHNNITDRMSDNENISNKKQQSIYYRSAREKEKMKIEFSN